MSSLDFKYRVGSLIHTLKSKFVGVCDDNCTPSERFECFQGIPNSLKVNERRHGIQTNNPFSV